MINPSPNWTVGVENLGLAIGADRSKVVMDGDYACSVLYCLSRKNGTIQWHCEPKWGRSYLDPFAMHAKVLIAAGHDLGLYRFDASTGAPLFVDRPTTLLGRFQHRLDTRSLNTSEVHAKPLLVQGDEVITLMGWKANIVTGKSAGKIDDVEKLWQDARSVESIFQSDGLRELEGIGFLHAGEPFGENKHKFIRWPLDWYCTNYEREILWHWNSQELSSIGRVDSYQSLKISLPYAYIMITDKKETLTDTPAAYYVVTVDLRSGRTTQVVNVGDGPLVGARVDAVDREGLVVRSYMPEYKGVILWYHETTSIDNFRSSES